MIQANHKLQQRTPATANFHTRRSTVVSCAGVALLEVILALALFVAAATVILSSLSSSVHAVNEITLSAQADDLAATVLTQIEIGQIALNDAGPTPFDDPSSDWTWQIITSAIDDTTQTLPLKRVEVVIVQPASSYTRRLVELIATPAAGTDTGNTTGSNSSSTSGLPNGGGL